MGDELHENLRIIHLQTDYDRLTIQIGYNYNPFHFFTTRPISIFLESEGLYFTLLLFQCFLSTNQYYKPMYNTVPFQFLLRTSNFAHLDSPLITQDMGP